MTPLTPTQQLARAIHDRDLAQATRAVKQGAMFLDGKATLRGLVQWLGDTQQLGELIQGAGVGQQARVLPVLAELGLAGCLASFPPLSVAMLAEQSKVMADIIKGGHHEVLVLLTQRGWDPRREPAGWTPWLIQIAALPEDKQYPAERMARLVLEAHSETHPKAMSEALATSMNSGSVRALLRNGWQPRSKGDLPLMDAWHNGAGEGVARAMLEGGIPLDHGPTQVHLDMEPDHPMAPLLTAAWRRQALAGGRLPPPALRRPGL